MDQRQETILQYYPLVRKIAYRISSGLPNHVDVQDLIHIGIVGLIEALDRFNPEHSPSFGAYAQIRIQGAILDNLRKQDWVPRSVRDRSNRIAQARRELQGQLQRAPNQAELAHHLFMSPEDFQAYLRRADVRTLLSTEALIGENLRVGESIAASDPTPFDETIENEQKRLIADQLARLKPREQLLIRLYYFEDYSFKEIAQQLEITESRVSQIHSNIKSSRPPKL